MRAITQGELELLRVDNDRGVVTATMTPDTASIIGLALEFYARSHSMRVDEPSLTAQSAKLYGETFEAETSDEIDRFEPISRMAAGKLNLTQDCVRELMRFGTSWQLHSRSGMRWPRDHGEDFADVLAREDAIRSGATP